MVSTPSTMVELGTKAPNFDLLNPSSGQTMTRDELVGPKGLLVIFMCNHCPYVKHILSGLRSLASDYQNTELAIVGISSNDVVNYPDDAPEKMAELDLGFPYLYDESQEVAKAYGAVCTPDIFLFNGSLNLVYRGQFDSSRPGNNEPVTGLDLRMAMDCVLEDKEVSAEQIPSVGCNIKWKN